VDRQRHILVFGNSPVLGALSSLLRVSPQLDVMECDPLTEVGSPGLSRPDVILVDAEQTTPEQFSEFIDSCPVILSVDPLTYQLTLLSSPCQDNRLVKTARVIEILSFMFQPA
jgi:hypothetical protein